MIWIPAGFAHGIYVMSSTAEILYKTTDYFAPQWERSLAWDDPTVNIDWPIQGKAPILSPKDQAGKLLNEIQALE
jgi:dTDP-4-dehydrorhamnose 3,5-epimerase